MSYPEQAPPRRPVVVRLAVAVLAVMAFGALGYALTGLTTVSGTVSRFRAAAVGTSADAGQVDAVVTLLWASTVVSAVVSVLAALLLVGLALGLSAGRSGARVATWVVAGLGGLLGCCAVVTLAVQRGAPLDFGDDRAAAELVDLIADAHPSWWIPLSATLSVGQVLGYLVVAVLLAVPSANAWFRRRPASPPDQPRSPYPPYQAQPQNQPPPWGGQPVHPPGQPYPPYQPGVPPSPPSPPR
ncbi:hypothetical protein [Micromonospora radicis]|uniref:Uncharacterized protein n=1 Tax=Micromonospora radicis TaxID=1894971 RepID=A0A418MWI5_9ACTN|nr:hypothetical protein [Micromonospora radicis]RIV38927.1 hypothetical protein D2L64_10910 [Micromonospora radicis]